ncbi:MAG: CBS domain-containing protein [Okeania sp. SIO3B5]|uniref:CBS domain-containing protein n=1 Tax=Okeania sp. SIO3B5 TaxID=2607811 RepID=UPI0013FF22F3|nr:CBS domain-containing protein [Okeania sp. SIO3B5]NEO57693.1 CBS domain-containing protein [Okeania sp. SIO3B5]
MKLRRVAEVMIDRVISARPDCCLLEIAKKMFTHKVSSVIIVEFNNQTTSALSADADFLTPLGIITEGDIVQFQALGLLLADYRAETVMSTPLFTVQPEDSLWSVHQLMEQKKHQSGDGNRRAESAIGGCDSKQLAKSYQPCRNL